MDYKICLVLSVFILVVASEDTAPAPTSPAEASNSVPGSSPANHGFTGTTTETKHPDGSVISVTHFKGNLPPQGGGAPQSFYNPFFASPYFYPFGPAGPGPYNPNLVPHGAKGPVSPVNAVPGALPSGAKSA